MTCFMFRDGIKQEIEEDVFDKMVELLHQSEKEEQPERFNRFRDDGTYDKRPNDPNYFSNYYRTKLSKPFQCPDCGRVICSKSNLSKHRQTNVCIRNRCDP